MLTSTWSLIGLLLLAFALRLYALGVPSVWLDEAHTWYFVSQPWTEMIQLLRAVGVHPPLYFGLEKIVVQAFGDLEWSLRIASVFVDMLALAVAARIGQLAGGNIGRLVAACYWAFRPMTIWYAGEARPYAMAVALAYILMAVFLMLQRRSTRRRWLAAWAVMTAGLLIHYFFFLTAGALTLWALVDLRRAPRFLRGWLLCVVLAVIPLVLWLYWMFQQAQVTLGIGWITRPAMGDYPGALWSLFSGSGNVWTPGVVLFGIFVLILAGAGVILDSAPHLARRALGAGILIPVGVVWLISQVRPVYVDRYFMVLLPFVGVMISVGAHALWHKSADRRSRGLVSGALLAFALAGCVAGLTVHLDSGFAREDWRSVAALLQEQPLPRPQIWLTDPEALVPLRYYYREEVPILNSAAPPLCTTACWYVSRQSYPVGHRLYRPIAEVQPILPDSSACQAQLQWASPTGLAVWRVKCD